MGQYKLALYFNAQIGLMMRVNDFSIDILLPFISVHIGLLKDAKGFNFFDIWISK